MLCLSLAACKGKDFDAKGYVKSVLDAHYHGEYKDYAKYLDISEEEAKADLDKDVDQQIDQEVAAIIDLGDEGKARYKEMLEKVEKLAKYEVKDAKKQDNGNYVVTVEVEPSQYIPDAGAEFHFRDGRESESGTDAVRPGSIY